MVQMIFAIAASDPNNLFWPKQIVRIAGSDSEDHLNHLITGDVVSPGQVTHSIDSIITWHNRIVEHNRIAGHNQINGRAVTQ